jgi:hypothetical protein
MTVVYRIKKTDDVIPVEGKERVNNIDLVFSTDIETPEIIFDEKYLLASLPQNRVVYFRDKKSMLDMIDDLEAIVKQFNLEKEENGTNNPTKEQYWPEGPGQPPE